MFGLLVVASAVALSGAAGCAKKDVRVNVSGTVKVKDQPLTKGVVMIMPANGNVTSALIRQDGSYTVTDVTPGEVKIAVTEFVMDRDPTQGAGSKRAAIPEKYKDTETSGLKYTVGSSDQTIDLDLN